MDKEKYITIRQSIDDFFNKVQAELNASLTSTRNSMLNVLQQKANIQHFDMLKSNHKRSFQEAMSDSNSLSIGPLKKHVSAYLEILRTNHNIETLEKDFGSAIEKISESFIAFKDRLSSIDALLEVRRKEELPNHIDVTKLELGKTIVAEGRVFPQSIEYVKEIDVVVTGDSRGNIALWNPDNFKQICCVKIHDNIINSVKYEHNRRLLITASKDSLIKIIKIDPGAVNPTIEDASGCIKCVKTIRRHSDAVRSLLIIEEKGVFLSAGMEPGIRINDLYTFKSRGFINTGNAGDVGYQMLYLKNKNIVAAGFKVGRISLFHLFTKNEIVRLDTGYGPNWYIDSLLYLKKEDAILASVGNKMVKKWKFSNKFAFETKEYPVTKGVETMLPFQGEERVLLGCMGSRLVCLNLDTGNCQESLDTGLTKSVTVLYIEKYDKFVVGDWKSHRLVILK